MTATASPGSLSKRGEKNAAAMDGRAEKLFKVLRNQYDSKYNPEGVVVCGIADNSLCRKELVDYFNTQGKLDLEPRDLTYADRLFASGRLIKALQKLINTIPDGLHSKEDWKAPLKHVKDEHILVGNGATGILDALFWALCNPGEGVLLSVPYYNAFDNDLVTRADAKIIEVHSKLPESSLRGAEPLSAFSSDTIKAYEEAYDKAEEQGILVKALLVCNPHNPTGAIYPRETIIELAKFAAKRDLHLVMDEIYARSIFPTEDVSQPTQFWSILGIDTEAEAGLDASRVHVVTSASKDFSINGFRLGVFISQNNKKLIDAMSATAVFAQAASPAAQLWSALLNDDDFLHWYLAANRKRLTKAYDFLIHFFQHHDIPYVSGNAGHFLLIDLRRFLKARVSTTNKKAADGSGADNVEALRNAEAQLSSELIDNGVYIAPGKQYHHPIPGFFRFTFSIEPTALKVGLERMEKTLGLEAWITQQTMPEYESL